MALGLAGDAERAGAGLADAAGEQVDVDDGVHLVHAGGGLVDPLAEHGDGLRGAGEQLVEGGDFGLAQAGDVGDVGHRAAGRDGILHAFEMADVGVIRAAAAVQVAQQAGEECHVGAGRELEVGVGAFAGGGAAGVDDDDAHVWPGGAGGGDALEQDGVAPGGVAADQDQEVCEFEILVDAGDDVLAEGPAVAGDGGGHAEAGVAVDVGGAEEALGEFVGGVIVLGEELARDVERHAVRAVLGLGGAEGVGDAVECGVPIGADAVHFRVEQAAVEGEGFAEGGAFDAEAAEIGWVDGVAGDGGEFRAGWGGQHAAADAAIGAGGADGGGRLRFGHQ